MSATTTVAAESFIELPPGEAFDLFGQRRSASWLFNARCESVTVGTAVSLSLPLDPQLGRHTVELLGRISAVRPGSQITIEHDQPWRGRIRLTLDPAGARRTRVRVRADVTSGGVEWLLRRRGIPLPDSPPTGNVRVGILTSKSGPGAVYAMAAEYLAELAVDEVNGGGGVGGRRLELLVADDATDAAQAGAEAHRLLRAGCRAIFACTTSSSFAAVRQAVGRTGVLLVHPVINEGGGQDDAVVRFGERPGAQVAALAGPLMKAAGGRRWYLVGQDYCWSHGAHTAARRALAELGGQVVGDTYTPLGTLDFERIIEQISGAGPDIVLSSLVGSDEVAFQRQCADAGLRAQAKALSLVMDESTYEHVGAAAAEGVVTALGYFQDAPAAGNADLVRRYRDRYGPWAPPISSLSETVYEAVVQYAQAVRANPDDHPVLAHRALLQHRSRRGGTGIGERDLLSQHLYLAEAGRRGLRVFDEAG